MFSFGWGGLPGGGGGGGGKGVGGWGMGGGIHGVGGKKLLVFFWIGDSDDSGEWRGHDVVWCVFVF